MANYYLFGSEAVSSYWNDEPIECDYDVFMFDDNPSELLQAFIGWGDYAEISETMYNSLNKKNNG